MSIQTFPYNKQLKKVMFQDIDFNLITLVEIPEPYYCDYSHHKSEMARNFKKYDTMGFRDILLKELSDHCGQTIYKLLVITPKKDQSSYDAFAYLANKEIAGVQLPNSGNFGAWMSIVFEKQYQKLEEYHSNGQFERQPGLNQNPQFMLILGKGEYSIKWVNSGMLMDEKPYENTGAYLYKNAPKQFNEAKIAKEKHNYLKKYINTEDANLDNAQLKKLYIEFLKTKNLEPNSSENKEEIYTEFESLASYKFPLELKAMLSIHTPSETSDFLTAEQILAEWKNWKEIFDDVNWMLVDLTGNNHPDGKKTIGMYTNPYWIPFMSTGGGNFVAIDYAPSTKGSSGQIIAFGPDENKIRFIAENMVDFLQQLLAGKDLLNMGYEH